jgi:hypothetical protein
MTNGPHKPSTCLSLPSTFQSIPSSLTKIAILAILVSQFDKNPEKSLPAASQF